ncbi:MAG: LCP family protein [Synechococcales bacterium]|nr:LCP family protein [Synechococcales bacterium]
MSHIEPETRWASSYTSAPASGSGGDFDCDSSAQPRPRQSGLVRGALLAIAFGTTVVLSGTIGAIAALTVPLSEAFVRHSEDANLSLQELWRKGVRHEVTRPVNILVMGIDEVQGIGADNVDIFSGRSDTMLLVRVDPTQQAASVMSIPRDTQVNFPGRRDVTKINHANLIGGPKLAAEVVSHNLNGVAVDRYVRFNTGAFRELVDLLGGVEVYVPQRMFYEDHTQKLYIDLQEGLQTLNGDEAEQFARFRSDGNGDIGRVQRQQQLIQALRDRLTSPAVIPRIPQILQLMGTYIDTNLTAEELLALINFALDIDQQNFHMVMLPGRFSQASEYIASYWILNPLEVEQVMQDFFQVKPYREVALQSEPLRDLRIAVQNATGYPRVASQVVRYLQDQGFENVYVVEDWPTAQLETEIIVQRGNLQGGSQVEHILGLGHVLAASTGDLRSDLTIRIGQDWRERARI